MTKRGGPAFLLLVVLTVAAARAAAQAPRADTVTVQAGPQYTAGGLHRALFGAEYRSLWTLPLRAATASSTASGPWTRTPASCRRS